MSRLLCQNRSSLLTLPLEYFPSTEKTLDPVRLFQLGDIIIFLATADTCAESTTPLTEMRLTGSRATVAIWAPLSDYIITGHESGKIAKYDVKTGEEVQAVEDEHSGLISDIQLSPDGTYFITASKDKTARVSGNRKDCRAVADCGVTRSCGTLKLLRL